MECTWRSAVTPNRWSDSCRGSAGAGGRATSLFLIKKRPRRSSTNRSRPSVGRGRATRFGVNQENSAGTTPTLRALGELSATFWVAPRPGTGCCCSVREAPRARRSLA